MKGPLKTTFIGHAESADFCRASEKQRQIERARQVLEQEKSQSRLNLKTKKNLEAELKQSEEHKAKELEYARQLQLLEAMKREKEKAEFELGEAHRKAKEAEQERVRKEEERQRKIKETEQQMKLRTQKAAEFQRSEEFQVVGKYREAARLRRNVVTESFPQERESAQQHSAYLLSCPVAEETDPLEYDAYNRTDNREGRFSQIDFSKTHFHNPAVQRHYSEGENSMNAFESAKIEYERLQEQNRQRALSAKKKLEEEKLRAAEALKKEANSQQLREFSAEMSQQRARDGRERAERTNKLESKNHSEKALTSLTKQVESNSEIEKAFEKEILGDKPAWIKEEIDGNNKNKSGSKKDGIKGNRSLSKDKKKTQQQLSLEDKQNGVRELERNAIEKATSTGKNIKLIMKPPLDTNAYLTKSRQQQQSKQSQSPESSVKQQQQSIDDDSNPQLNDSNSQGSNLQSTVKRDNRYNNNSSSNNYDEIKPQEDVQERKKKIRFVDKGEDEDEEDYSRDYQSGKKDQLNKNNTNNSQRDYQYQGNNSFKSNPVDISGDSSRESIKNYLQEQEEYLRKIAQSHNNIHERMREEEENFYKTLNKATNAMSNKMNQLGQQDEYHLEDNEVKKSKNQYNNQNKQQQQQYNPSSLISGGSPNSDKQQPILIEENHRKSDKQQRQVIYSSSNNNNNSINNNRSDGNNNNNSKKASALLDQFLTEPVTDSHRDSQDDYVDNNNYNNNQQQQQQQYQTSQSKRNNQYHNTFNDSWRVEEEHSQVSSDFTSSQDSRKRATVAAGGQQQQPNHSYDTFSPDKQYKHDIIEEDTENTNSLNNQYLYNSQNNNNNNSNKNIKNNNSNTYSLKNNNSRNDSNSKNFRSPSDAPGIPTGSSHLFNSHNHNNNSTNSKDLVELTDSLLGGNNSNYSQYSQSIDKNPQSNARKQWEASPMNSELSYSLSDIDRSAEKVRVQVHPSQSLGRKTNNDESKQQKPLGRTNDTNTNSGTAKFSVPLTGPARLSVEFKHDDEDEERKDDYHEDDEEEQDVLESHSKPESLADMFKKKKGSLSKKIEERQANLPSSGDHVKKERTKEDILKQRKEMMKVPDFIQKEKQQQQQQSINSSNSNNNSMNGSTLQQQQQSNERGLMKSFHDPNKQIREPSQELMDRLANGSRAKVEKKDYLKLTNKNYDQLPEVKKRKEEEFKREEAKKRQENVKLLQQSIKEAQNTRNKKN